MKGCVLGGARGVCAAIVDNVNGRTVAELNGYLESDDDTRGVAGG